MKKIAIFTSGAGEATERIVKLFNEGNRLRTVLVVTDDAGEGVLEKLHDEDVLKLHIADEEWHQKNSEIAELLKDHEVRLLVLDGFDLALSDEIMEAVDGEMIRVSSPEQAPREVVAALEADLRKPVEEPAQDTVKEDETPSPESEWADALKIQFTPPKVPDTPPAIPSSEIEEIIEEPQPKPYPDNFENREYRPHREERFERERKEEPMPSTWLIWSVLVTVFCCFIPGIIAIIFSSQVSSKYYAGDIEGAKRASRIAEIWIIVSFVLGVLSATLYMPFMLMGWI